MGDTTNTENSSTEIAFVLDRSGSMHSMLEAAISGFNDFLRDQKSEPAPARFSLVLFDDQYELPFDRVDIQEVSQLDTHTFVPRGCTALLDAIGRTIVSLRERIDAAPQAEKPGKVILAILTDGLENASKEYDIHRINDLISEVRKLDWDIFFLGANQDAIATAVSLGIDRQNSATYAASAAGMAASTGSLSQKMRFKRRKFAGTASAEDIALDEMDLSATYEKNEQAEKNKQ